MSNNEWFVKYIILHAEEYFITWESSQYTVRCKKYITTPHTEYNPVFVI